MVLNVEATFFVDEPPEFEYRDGLFRVVVMVGGQRIERVMQPSTFARSVWRAEQALALFRSGANVAKFGPKAKTG
jgi:hypothetical protein